MKKILLPLATALNLLGGDFPQPYNSEPEPSSPMPAAEAAVRMKLPRGFKATVFAAEPDVQNPIAMAWDGRGRLWVAENYTYAERAKRFNLNLRDRVLIFEDKDGDGHFDTRKVFTDEVQMLTSVEVGYGGVWLMCPPRLLFVPDRNHDDTPDGAPEVVLDGFTPPPENYHNFANGLRFGPDGWLYGRCGASSPGDIGAPGTPAEKRIPMRGTIWRYHPVRKVFEAVSSGTTNPWGHDWDEHGELFFINTVNGHLWHDFAGAHYVRPHTIDPNPRVYATIDQHADHWHFNTAEGWNKSGDGRADAYGGGHAHVGAMIYLGDNWPDDYRGRLFTLNLHGRRANQEILERKGSGYIGRHGADFFQAADPWFRGMDLSYGPDGGVFVLDWSDTGECHDSTGVHRTSGRIYKITHGDPRPARVGDISKLRDSELVKLQEHRNEWFARQGRIELATRAATGNVYSAADRQATSRWLTRMFREHRSATMQLRALWALYVRGEADRDFLRGLLADRDEHIRAWAIRLLTDEWPLDTVMGKRPPGTGNILTERTSGTLCAEFAKMAAKDASGLVRLTLASTLQRMPVERRGATAAGLMSREKEANDHNIPLLVWYGLIPVADSIPGTLPALAERCELPATRKFMARRLAEDADANPGPLNELVRLATAKPEAIQRDLVEGMAEGLAGWRKATKPAAWDDLAAKLDVSGDGALRDAARSLSALFGDGRALTDIKRIAVDQNAELAARKTALQALIDAKAPGLREICEALLAVRFLNPIAARGLAGIDDPEVAAKLVRSYPQFHPSERPQLLAVLVSRPVFAQALLEAMAANRISKGELSAYHARQIRTLNDPTLEKKLTETWGQARELQGQSPQIIAKWKAQLAPATLAKADFGRGRAVFNQICASCHTLHGEGGKIGPDLTGAGRDNLDYLLENIVDPSAVVTADFRMSVVKLKDGSVLNGIAAAKTDRTLTLKTMTEILTVERSDVVSNEVSPVSLMPEGLLDSLTPEQARDLIGYLMQPAQVPLPRNAEEKGK